MGKLEIDFRLGNGIYKHCLSSWDSFHEFVLNVYNSDTYIYRGQPWGFIDNNKKEQQGDKDSNLSSSLLPSVLRDLMRYKPSKEEYIKWLNMHLYQFRRSIKGRTNILELLRDDDDEAWALGQHYGLKTPLLDFTYSPYVAAFFALVNADSLESKHCSVYAVSQQFINSTTEFEIYRTATDHNRRLLNQNGLFVKFNQAVRLEDVLRKTIDENCEKVKLLEVLIPINDREKALKHLDSMNINYRTLFPDLQGSSDHANELLRKKILNVTITAQKKQDIETLNEVERMHNLNKTKL